MRKSWGMNRGVLRSACTPEPPTVFGRWLTSPMCVRAPADTALRKVRGSTVGSGMIRLRWSILSSSFEK